MKRKKCFFQTAGSMGSSVRAGGERLQVVAWSALHGSQLCHF